MGTEMIWSQTLAGPGQEDTFSTRIQGQPKQHSKTSSTGKNDNKSGEISQLAKTLVAKPDKLNSIPITQGVEGKRKPMASRCPLTSTSVLWHSPQSPHKQNNQKWSIEHVPVLQNTAVS